MGKTEKCNLSIGDLLETAGFTEATCDSAGFVFIPVGDGWMECRGAEIATNLNPDELPLGETGQTGREWLAIASRFLKTIHKARNQAVPGDAPFCIFLSGDVYVQFLALPDSDSELLAEAVSARSVPEIARLLTPARERQLFEYGFEFVPNSPNYARTVRIGGRGDVEFLARLSFRILRDVYGVHDFGPTTFTYNAPKGPTWPGGTQSRERGDPHR